MGNRARQSEGATEFMQGLCEEYRDEAAALWECRKKASTAPNCDLDDLRGIDARLEAQFDALRVAGEPGWEICKRSFEDDAGKCFAASVFAFESADEIRVDLILGKAASSPELSEGVISALHWLPYEKAGKHIQKLLESKSADSMYMGIASSALHRRDPKYYLDDAINSTEIRLKARALLAVGELGRKSSTLLTGRLRDNFNSPDPIISFAAAWSSALMGDAKAVDTLQKFVNSGYPFSGNAINIAMRRMAREDAIPWQIELAKSTATLRLALLGAGIIGDPLLIPWLLEQMLIPGQARAAGEAFTMITGIDILRSGMEDQCPAGFSVGPNDDPSDSNVELDPDEFLAWPNRELLAAWWKKSKDNFQAGTRLLLGKTLTRENILSVLSAGSQRQRAAAAMELGIIEPGRPLYNIFDTAWRQMPQPTPAMRAVYTPVNYGLRELVITAVNCITPVGLDAEMTAASVRARIPRHVCHEEYRDAPGDLIKIGQIAVAKDNVKDIGERLGKIANICLEDMLEGYFRYVPKWPAQCHLILGAASEQRPGPDYGKEIIDSLVETLSDLFPQSSSEFTPKGNPTLHYALKEAACLMSGNQESLFIIGAIESLLAESTLSWFEANNRLKSDSYGQQHGLIASEAVCFMVVEERQRAIMAKRPILARVAALGIGEEPRPRISGLSNSYTGLSKACQDALEPLGNRELKGIFSDLNGEDSRAHEWSVALLRCFNKNRQRPYLSKPHDFYGDIGAASGAVMVGIAAQGFIRNWLESPVMIFCSDDHGPCGAVILEKETETG